MAVGHGAPMAADCGAIVADVHYARLDADCAAPHYTLQKSRERGGNSALPSYQATKLPYLYFWINIICLIRACVRIIKQRNGTARLFDIVSNHICHSGAKRL